MCCVALCVAIFAASPPFGLLTASAAALLTCDRNRGICSCACPSKSGSTPLTSSARRRAHHLVIGCWNASTSLSRIHMPHCRGGRSQIELRRLKLTRCLKNSKFGIEFGLKSNSNQIPSAGCWTQTLSLASNQTFEAAQIWTQIWPQFWTQSGLKFEFKYGLEVGLKSGLKFGLKSGLKLKFKKSKSNSNQMGLPTLYPDYAKQYLPGACFCALPHFAVRCG